MLFFAALARLRAASYYVDYQSGNDISSGLDPSNAWQHCPGDPAATASPAACALQPGDTVYFRGGVTYQLTGASGILLNWDGASAAPITYDGNSANTWGSGRARFTDNYGGNALTAFHAEAARHDLAFRSLEISGMGGAPTLPPDDGTPIAPRFGGGIGFLGGASSVLISDCAFSELGYWFNQRPMDAASIAGSAITCRLACRGLSVAGCSFSRVADGCDLSDATELSQVRFTQCTFGDAIVWPVDLPASAGGVSTSDVVLDGSSDSNNSQFDTSAWMGYGNGPRVAISVVPAGGSVSFSASAAASPAPTFQWLKNGVAIPGATSPTLQLANLSLFDIGIYTARAANSAGSVMSNSVILAVTPNLLNLDLGLTTSPSTTTTVTTTAPTFTTQPASQIVSTSTTVTFDAAATGMPAPSYQWRKNGAVVAGGTNATLTLPSVTTNDNGTYSVVASNSAGSVTSRDAMLIVLEPAPAPGPAAPTVTEPSNLSTSSPLAKILLSSEAVIGLQPASLSFTISGTTTKQVLVRALGPALTTLGLIGVLGDPRFDLYREGLRIGENDNWGGSSALRDTFSRAGALPLTDPASKDSALQMWLPPGNYTVVVAGVNGAAGLALAEVYEVP